MRDANVFAFRKAMPRMSWSPRNLYNLWRRSCGAEAEAINFTRSPKTLFQQRWISKALVANGDLDAFAGRTEQLERAKKKAYDEKRKGLAPVGSLMLAEARRVVIHGSILLNGKKHTNANTRLAPGDMISVDPAAIRFLQEPGSSKAKSEVLESLPAQSSASTKSSLTPFNLPPYASPFIFIPAYAEVSFPTCSAIYVRHPTARPGYSEIPTPYDADGEVIRLAWEWYSKMRPRTRSKSQMAREPENRRPSESI
ncbi:uncharacterized protein BJ212DRAFT_1447767 [Suillus subaureus]|uniref:RNA-binding S4 domain-containing protein n=1 Tax=Suillus subaureus TaxID=48587 RepID=A0A9P7E830_9AGAM|nr:uncharacterized protein BJ212DRAFT_1447767 [Suillus subaureus]KAG1813511.1 hypothetical protein BJ212DRAFT_1447767 [Suillus subaureus]